MLSKLLTITHKVKTALWTSSVGRLFDAVAAWLLPSEAAVRGWSPGEGHLAMLLEALCSDAPNDNSPELQPQYCLGLIAGDPVEFDWRPLIVGLVVDFRRGHPPAQLATRFHQSLAQAIARIAALHDDLPVVMSGGVFQNRLLTEMAARSLADRNRPVGLPGVIPPGDGGLAAGQLAVAIAQLRSSHGSTKQFIKLGASHVSWHSR
jgi:hydrogenase maturation protein HypF